MINLRIILRPIYMRKWTSCSTSRINNIMLVWIIELSPRSCEIIWRCGNSKYLLVGALAVLVSAMPSAIKNLTNNWSINNMLCKHYKLMIHVWYDVLFIKSHIVRATKKNFSYIAITRLIFLISRYESVLNLAAGRFI